MENEYYRLCGRENYQKLADKLIKLDGTKVIELGERRTTRATYHFFVLSNGAGAVISRDDELIQLGVRDATHAQDTRDLLSKLTSIPGNKFIHVE